VSEKRLPPADLLSPEASIRMGWGSSVTDDDLVQSSTSLDGHL